jgi:hypothetical protein
LTADWSRACAFSGGAAAGGASATAGAPSGMDVRSTLTQIASAAPATASGASHPNAGARHQDRVRIGGSMRIIVARRA